MPVPSDYKELLKILNSHRVEYLLIGAYAVIYYTEPRYTKDLDIWINPERKNAMRLYKALKEFGAPLKNITVEDFLNKKLVYQIGIEPVRVDILMGIAKIEFEAAYKRRKIVKFDGLRVNILGINELLKAKKNVGRPVDILDIEKLKKVLPQRRFHK